MRLSCLLGLGLTVLFYVSCRERDAIESEKAPDNTSSLIIEPPAAPAPITKPEKSEADPPISQEKLEPPIIMQAQASDRVESLSFAHVNGMCVQVNADGQTGLQACDTKASGQKFLFARSLDGRVQLKDTTSQLCLAVGPPGVFFPAVLRGEVCESKSSQFFSVVDYGTTYSLKFDGNNTCMDAERSRADPGTRIILYRCSAVLNQKIQVKKKP